MWQAGVVAWAGLFCVLRSGYGGGTAAHHLWPSRRLKGLFECHYFVLLQNTTPVHIADTGVAKQVRDVKLLLRENVQNDPDPALPAVHCARCSLIRR